MSHDLRTPLNAVIGLSGIAMDETLSREEVRAYLNDIHTPPRSTCCRLSTMCWTCPSWRAIG
jgi:signal transduction histidine kinase